MPEIVRIFGIRICVFSSDHLHNQLQKLKIPKDAIRICVFSRDHLHAFYGEYEALIDIREGTVIAGSLSRRKLREPLEYLTSNQQDLLETFYQLNPILQQ